MNIEVQSSEARLRAPFVSSQGSTQTVSFQLVSVTDDEGHTGHGEAVGLGAEAEELRAAIDMARWDLRGHRAGEPAWRLLGGDSPPEVEVNATIAVPDRAGAAAAAAAARDAGFRCIKVKVGLGDDGGRLAAIRAAAGPDMAIRLDANGAWSPGDAIAALAAFEPIGIELCEEPAAGAQACAEVAAASAVPVALDESALDSLDRRVCDSVCLKLSRCGGIAGLIDAAKRARGAGYRVYLASLLDGPLGIAAALHAAAVVKPDYACGLATLGLFGGRADPLPPAAGCIAVPEGPGFGHGLLDWYR